MPKQTPKSRPALMQRVVRVGTAPVVALADLLAGRGRPQPMRSSPSVPASEGTLQVQGERNGNTRVTVRVKHLARASKLASDATTYVVWTRSQEGRRQNVGALALTANLEGALHTVTPHRWFQLTVTPEANGQVLDPAHDSVFTADVERLDRS